MSDTAVERNNAADRPPALRPGAGGQTAGGALEVHQHGDTQASRSSYGQRGASLVWPMALRIKRSSRAQRSYRLVRCCGSTVEVWAWDADPEFGEQAGEQWRRNSYAARPKKWNPRKQAQVLRH